MMVRDISIPPKQGPGIPGAVMIPREIPPQDSGDFVEEKNPGRANIFGPRNVAQ